MDDLKLLTYSLIGASSIGLFLYTITNRKQESIPKNSPTLDEQIISSSSLESSCPIHKTYSMYTPKHYQVKDDSEAIDLMRNNSFGLLMTWKGSEMHTSHVPFLVDELGDSLVLRFHLAMSNPHVKALEKFANKSDNDDWNCMVIFNGPHFYISPKWMVPDKEAQKKKVPTWDFTTVHAICDLCELKKSPEEKFKLVNDLSEFNEEWLLHNVKDPIPELDNYKYDFTNADEKYADLKLKQIACFSLNVKELKGKFKLSQNSPIEERTSIIEGLNRQGSDLAKETAKFMYKY